MRACVCECTYFALCIIIYNIIYVQTFTGRQPDQRKRLCAVLQLGNPYNTIGGCDVVIEISQCYRIEFNRAQYIII